MEKKPSNGVLSPAYENHSGQERRDEYQALSHITDCDRSDFGLYTFFVFSDMFDYSLMGYVEEKLRVKITHYRIQIQLKLESLGCKIVRNKILKDGFMIDYEVDGVEYWFTYKVKYGNGIYAIADLSLYDSISEAKVMRNIIDQLKTPIKIWKKDIPTQQNIRNVRLWKKRHTMKAA